MKTTIDIPDALFRKAKAKAAEGGRSLKDLVTEALQEKLAAGTKSRRGAEPPWMRGFGTLRHMRRETQGIQTRVDEAFEGIEPGDRA